MRSRSLENRANEELARMLLEGRISKEAIPARRATFVLWEPYLKQVAREWGEERARNILEKRNGE